ncbi:site-specific DNA-methyltransferase [Mycoplasmopsis bovis]|nr:site-specific DNA-methyltransferase [Mycoplasmopsis bovis]QQH28872.1 site-specific DNA-methyltransferase [Mycoplasmopsis bovis]
MTMNTIKQDYIEKANALSLSNELNQDQKDLIISIIDKFDDNDPALHNVYQLLIKRVKLGFVFDVAPSVNASEIALLKKDEKLSFNNDNNKPTNTLIIGENYDALKNLIVIEREKRERESQPETVNYDVIYIDPPYNTESSLTDGNNLSEKDDVSSSKFIYRDKFSRTGWLNMLNERLRLAKQLLKEDGVIFVSIDDSEQAYLKVLMDEIFGEENFISVFKWIRTYTPASLSSKVRKKMEYVLCYEKKRNNREYNVGTITGGDMPLLNDTNNKKELSFNKHHVKFGFNGYFEKGLYEKVELMNNINIKNGNSDVDFVLKGKFKWSQQFLDNELLAGTHILIKSTKFSPRYLRNEIRNKKPSDIISMDECEVETNETAKKEIESIFINNTFMYPKPISLIKYLISIIPNKNARILDFYAGSGTTGHAVMELNKEDGGNRSYTLVTNNENNIATNVCYERLYRINNGISTNNESNFDWIKENKPYNSNLNVYNIEYYSTKLFDDNQSNISIKEQYIKMLQDFNIDTEDKDSNIDILRSLTSLKPMTKD